MTEQAQSQELEVISKESQELVTKAKGMKIATTDDYIRAADFLKLLKGMQKRAGLSFDPIIKKANATWKEALGQKAAIVDPLETAEKLIKGEMGDYDALQRQKAAEAQAKADLAARKEREALEARAAKAEASGKAEKAETLRNQAMSNPVPIIEKNIPKVQGVSFRENWEYDIVDVGMIPREYFTVDTGKLKNAVNLFKKTDAIPGIRAFRKDIVSGRGN